MKKVFAMLLALCMVFALCACGTNETPAEEPVATEEPVVEEPIVEEPVAEEPAVEVMSYADYAAAELETQVTVEAYVQDTQSWWNDQITVYAQDEDGAYFFYNMACSEEDAAKLVPGTKIRATGYKAEWSGEVEIIDATFEIIEGSFIAEPLDVTALLGTDELIAHQNEKVAFKGLTVVAKDDGSSAFYYAWDNSGAEGTDADLYFDASIDGQTYGFVIEYYLRNESTEAYQTVQNLKVGDVIDLEGFLYWYNGVEPHITSVVVK